MNELKEKVKQAYPQGEFKEKWTNLNQMNKDLIKTNGQITSAKESVNNKKQAQEELQAKSQQQMEDFQEIQRNLKNE